MKKGALVEMVQQMLADGQPVDDTELKFSYQSVEFMISLAVQDIRTMIASKPTMTEVLEDNNRFYVNLPYTPLSGPDSVLSISAGHGYPPFNYHSSYVTYMNMLELKGDLLSNGYYPEDDRYYFHRNPGDEVLVVMIPAFSEYDEDDEFTFQDQHLFVIEKVMQLYQNSDRRLQDYLNNQNAEDERITGK